MIPGGAAVSRRATSAYLRSWGAQVLPGAQVACHLIPQAHGCCRRAPTRVSSASDVWSASAQLSTPVKNYNLIAPNEEVHCGLPVLEG